jgi:hypothetical protein
MPKPSQRKLLLEVTLAVPVEEAWKALKDPALIREWFGYYGADYSTWGMDELKTLDDEIKVVFEDEAVYDDEFHRITWEGGDEFVLIPQGDVCGLEVFMVRPAPQSEMDWKKVYDPICEGWISFVQQLRFFLNRHRNHERSTIFMTGLAAPDTYANLQLEDLAAVDAGERYELLTGIGDFLSGEVWYKTHYQIGLTVDAFGDGLLIVAATPPTEELPEGGAELTITTFLDDSRFDELQQRWGLAFSFAGPQSSKAAPGA